MIEIAKHYRQTDGQNSSRIDVHLLEESSQNKELKSYISKLKAEKLKFPHERSRLADRRTDILDYGVASLRKNC